MCNHFVVLICIFLISLFWCLLTFWISSSINCLFIFFAHLLTYCPFLLMCSRPLYVCVCVIIFFFPLHALEISSPNLWLTSTLGIFVERSCKFFWGGGAVLGLQCGKRASPVAMLGFSCPTACGILVPQPGIVLLSPELEKSDSLPLDHQGSSKSCTWLCSQIYQVW